ncbi:beta-1,4-N-acetylgalactosaminyltransferase bre-4-like [Eriocheir sinensis]|uniref:beta-1,4-N-acetylgalactosaminyltransferase bre-4-like n=1 Tax=Eriocheir sinensis TaxID=95602 RepID=UPI0021C6FD54|nr:beta-1,4-N-acetylgalactosaminyltransferase bre-4-like [Eriocheir sinensis]
MASDVPIGTTLPLLPGRPDSRHLSLDPDPKRVTNVDLRSFYYTGRCGRLVLLTFVTLVIGHFLLFNNGITLSRHPGSVLPNSTITWLNPSLLDGQEKHRFLNTEGGEAGGDAAILVDPAVPAADGGGENGTAHTARRPCPADPPGLVGRLRVERNPPSLEEQERTHPELTKGGHYWPRNCTALHKVAIIIPYRDRRSHLAALVHHLHPFLQRQLIEYNIYVVEQAGNGPFNRGMLMNVGFTEAVKEFPYDCILLHDVDLVPEDDRNLYTCPQPPRHMSASISSHNYRLLYQSYFGGVSAMTADQYRAINGFSNEFWGWGGEDDDLFSRVRHQKLNISRYPGDLGRYTMLSHKKAEPNPTRVEVLHKGRERFKTNGLNSLKYQILKTERRQLFTWMLVALPRP